MILSNPRRRSNPILTFGLALILQLPLVAPGQTSDPTQPRFILQGSPEQLGSAVIRDSLNRPCLDVEAISRAHVVNPDVIDHVVSVKNRCSRTIMVKVCYFQTERCKEFDIRAYDRVDIILGTMTKVGRFRYSLFQK